MAPGSGDCLHTVIEKWARLRPDATALVSGNGSLSYSSLNQLADRFHIALRRQDLRRGSVVAIYLRRSLSQVAAIIGTLKAGCAYLPIDIGEPAFRRDQMLRDAGAAVVIADRSSPDLPGFIPILDLTLIEEGSSEGVVMAPQRVLVSADDLAQVIFTSGSTGMPKGAMLQHRTVLGFSEGVAGMMLNADDRLLQHSSVSWDAPTLEMWMAFKYGAQCVLHFEDKATIEGLAYSVRAYAVTVLWLNASLLATIAEVDPLMFSGLRAVWTGAERLFPATVRRVFESNPHLVMINGYGPSECGVFSTTFDMSSSSVIDDVIPIGRATGNRSLYLLDETLQPVPPGVPGEIFIGGPNVSWGYAARPGLTAAAYLPDPCDADGGARMYRSGDLARRREDGTLEFIGRRDSQIKMRGYRVELGEIEAVLSRHPGIREAVVFLHGESRENQHLVAFVIADADASPSDGMLGGYLRQHLPPHMVPARVRFVDRFPRLPNGKVDRRALQAASTEASARAEARDIEKSLVILWSRVLVGRSIEADTNFFDLGGHSLAAVRIAERVRKFFEINMSVRDIFDNPTIRELGILVSERRRR